MQPTEAALSAKTLKIVSLVLGLIAYYAFQTGSFLLGGIALAVNGFLMVITPQKPLARVIGGLLLLYGLYVVAAMLGLLALSVTALIDPQTALIIGVALLVLGYQIVRRVPKHRKIGVLIAVIGALLIAYGYGLFG